LNTITILLLLLGLHMAVTERIRPAIHSLAAQGVLLGLLPFLAAPVPAWRAAGLALALRFVPYSDNHGHFHAFWTAVMVALALLALATSVYLVYVLEILKLRRGRLNPETGEIEAITLQDAGETVEPSRHGT